MTPRFATATGLAMMSTGWIKAVQHTAPGDPFAASWCRTPDLVAPAPGFDLFAVMSGHCWGCGAIAAGAALFAVGLTMAFLRHRRTESRLSLAIS